MAERQPQDFGQNPARPVTTNPDSRTQANLIGQPSQAECDMFHRQQAHIAYQAFQRQEAQQIQHDQHAQAAALNRQRPTYPVRSDIINLDEDPQALDASQVRPRYIANAAAATSIHLDPAARLASEGANEMQRLQPGDLFVQSLNVPHCSFVREQIIDNVKTICRISNPNFDRPLQVVTFFDDFGFDGNRWSAAVVCDLQFVVQSKLCWGGQEAIDELHLETSRKLKDSLKWRTNSGQIVEGRDPKMAHWAV